LDYILEAVQNAGNDASVEDMVENLLWGIKSGRKRHFNWILDVIWTLIWDLFTYLLLYKLHDLSRSN